MKTPKVPTYGHHKPTGQARCYVAGKSVYLGKYGSEESRIRFGEIVDRDRDPDCSEAPPTPPGVRVRTGRFISVQ